MKTKQKYNNKKNENYFLEGKERYWMLFPLLDDRVERFMETTVLQAVIWERRIVWHAKHPLYKRVLCRSYYVICSNKTAYWRLQGFNLSWRNWIIWKETVKKKIKNLLSSNPSLNNLKQNTVNLVSRFISK